MIRKCGSFRVLGILVGFISSSTLSEAAMICAGERRSSDQGGSTKVCFDSEILRLPMNRSPGTFEFSGFNQVLSPGQTGYSPALPAIAPQNVNLEIVERSKSRYGDSIHVYAASAAGDIQEVRFKFICFGRETDETEDDFIRITTSIPSTFRGKWGQIEKVYRPLSSYTITMDCGPR